MTSGPVTQDPLEALHCLVLSNDLPELESHLANFNVFEAMGAVRMELRHSDFLGFLMDPQQSHGLGAQFVQRFLIGALRKAKEDSHAVRLHLSDLDDLRVLREWENIDILLVSDANELVVVIENKIDAAEGDKQLERYTKTAERIFPDHERLHVFLTPTGRRSASNESPFIPVGYNVIMEALAAVKKFNEGHLSPEVNSILGHYEKVVRRHVLEKDEVRDLAQLIYRRHRLAIDTILKYRHDLQQVVSDDLKCLVEERPDLNLVYSSKTYVHFVPEQWDKLEVLKSGGDWAGDSNDLVRFEFRNEPDKGLRLNLVVGPGDLRQDCCIAFADAGVRKSGRGAKWTTVWDQTFLSKKSYAEANERTGVAPAIREKWDKFCQTDLGKLTAILAEAAKTFDPTTNVH